MSKQLFNNPNGHRGATLVSMPMHELYRIVKQRLDMAVMAIENGNSLDPDAACQSICVEIEKQQGTFPNLGSEKLND